MLWCFHFLSNGNKASEERRSGGERGGNLNENECTCKEKGRFFISSSPKGPSLSVFSSWRSADTSWLIPGILERSGGAYISWSHEHGREITYSTQSSAEPCSKAPYDSPSHRISAGKRGAIGEPQSSPPEELHRGMEGQGWR